MSSRSVRIQMVRIVREVMQPTGKTRDVVSYEKRSVNRVGGIETVRVDNSDYPLTRFGVRVPHTEVTIDLVQAAINANAKT